MKERESHLTIISCALHNIWQDLVFESDVRLFLTGGYLRAGWIDNVNGFSKNNVGHV
jgi:hypothetical protein